MWVIQRTERRAGTGQQLVGELGGGRVVEVAGGLVEHQDRLVGEQRASDAEPGPFAAREPGVAVAEPGVQPVGQVGQPAVQPGPADRVGDLRVGGVRPGEPHVLDERGGEHVGVVVDQAGEPAYVVECKAAELLAAVPQLARGGVEEADQQCGERALARAGSTDQRDALARVQSQRALRGGGCRRRPTDR